MMRRSLLKLLGLGPLAMRGTGGTPPQPAGYVPPTLPGQAAGPQHVIRARLVIVPQSSSRGQGVFVYTGNPGPGNPPQESMSNASLDPYGNGVTPGVVSYGAGGSTAQMLGDQLILFAGGAGGPAILFQSAAGVLSISSGTTTAVGDTQATITVGSANASGGNPTILLGAASVKLASGASAQIPNTRPAITALGSTWNATTAAQANTNFTNIINFLTAIGVST